MAERVGEVRAQSQAKDVTLLKKHSTIEVLVIDDADTVVVNSMANVENAKVINLADSVDVTVLIAGNVITIDDVSISGSHLVMLVTGA